MKFIRDVSNKSSLGILHKETLKKRETLLLLLSNLNLHLALFAPEFH